MKQITNFIRLLIQRAHKTLFNYFSNKNLNDKDLDLEEKMKHDIEMRSDFNVTEVNTEKIQTRNWRYHLTNYKI